MTLENTLLAFEQDIRDRGFWDWIKAHTSFMKPLHRYSGMLSFESQVLVFHGQDKKGNGKLNLQIPLNSVTDIHFDFDDVFRRSEDRQLGLAGFKPLRITYQENNKKRTVYLFASFHRSMLTWRLSRNPELYEHLSEAVGANSSET